MDYEFKDCLEKGKLIKIKIDKEIIKKELRSAKYDMNMAKASFSKKDFKWTTIQSYYVIFHCCRALIYSKNYKEKSHRALLIALRELFSDVLGEDYIRSFEEAIDLREEADYRFNFSESSAKSVLNDAEKFLEKTKTIISYR